MYTSPEKIEAYDLLRVALMIPNDRIKRTSADVAEELAYLVRYLEDGTIETLIALARREKP